MNSLSWLIYFAGLCSSFEGYTWLFAFFCGICIIVLSVNNEELTIPKFVYVLPFVMVINIFVPTRETVYAIAASEYGETIIKSKVAGKAETALNAWLDKQIQQTKQETK